MDNSELKYIQFLCRGKDLLSTFKHGLPLGTLKGAGTEDDVTGGLHVFSLHLGMFDFGALRDTICLQFQKNSYFEMIVGSLEIEKIVQRSHVPVFSIGKILYNNKQHNIITRKLTWVQSTILVFKIKFIGVF